MIINKKDTSVDSKSIVSREILIYIIVGVDIISMIILFVCLIIVLKSTKTATDLLNTKIKKLSHFSVRITDLDLIGHAQYEEIEMLLKHIDYVQIEIKIGYGSGVS